MPAEITDTNIRVSVADQNLFDGNTFRTIDISKSEKIKAIIGEHLIEEPNAVKHAQAFLFDKDAWTEEAAVKWAKDHGYDIKGMIEHFGKAIKRSSMNTVIKEVNESDRTFWATASTEERDRAGDVIRTDGWDLKNFEKNPVLLFAHDYSQLPIGKVIELECDKNKKCMRFKPKFATAEEYPFADQVFKLYKAGYMNAFSVGFNPLEWSEFKDDQGYGIEFLKQELLEISAVPVPCNFSALKDKGFQMVMAKAMGSELTDVKPEPKNEEPKPEPKAPPIADPKSIQLVSPITPEQIKEFSGVLVDMKQLLTQLREVESSIKQKLIQRIDATAEMEKTLSQMRKLAK